MFVPRFARLSFLTKVAAVMLLGLWAVGHAPAQSKLTDQDVAAKIVQESREATRPGILARVRRITRAVGADVAGAARTAGRAALRRNATLGM